MERNLVFGNQNFFDFVSKSTKFAHFNFDLVLNFAKRFLKRPAKY